MEVEQVVGTVALEKCAKALLDTLDEGDLFDDVAGDLLESRGYNFDGPDTVETIAAYDVVEAALAKLRERSEAPYGRCNECGKPAPFDHDVPNDSGELVCDVCAGAPEDEVDW